MKSFVKTIKEYFWSLWFALPSVLSDLGIGLICCGVWTIFYYKGVPALHGLFLIFLAMLGARQFDYDIIMKVEKKVGYQIISNRYRKK